MAEVTRIRWDIINVLAGKCNGCVPYLITVKFSCNILFCYSYGFGETRSHKVSFVMLYDSVRLGVHAASQLGRGLQWGFVNGVFDIVFYFLLFSCFLLSNLIPQCLYRDLSFVKMFYGHAVSSQAAVMSFQIPEYGDP